MSAAHIARSRIYVHPKICGRLLVPALLALALTGLFAKDASAAPCDPPITNAIVCENSKPGNPPSEWDVSGSGDSNIQGFATDISVDQGQTVHFKVKTPSNNYRLDIYRMGYYGGQGARKVATVQPSASLPQSQPSCLTQSATGLIDCGNWGESASWAVPADAVSGIYFAKLVREDQASEGSHIMFVVRDDDGQSNLLFQTSDTTWQAYNQYGGNSLYVGGPGTNPGRAYKVSYNRPLTVRGTSSEDSPFNAEYPMVRWLERNGYDVSYFTGVDTDRRGAEILEHKAFLSVGHDEYWSGTQRANVEAARDAGVNLAFFSGNEIFWKTRWENSIDGSNTDHRTLVCYKETHANAKIDPESNVWTGTWRDPRFSPPADGGRPENALSGTIFMVNSGTTAIQVPAADGKMRLWRNTNIASLAPNQTATLSANTLGYEWDEELDNGSRPAGLVDLSSTTASVSQRLLDQGSNYGPGTATHHLTLYRAPSGALVFGAGTIQWSWGLDGNHDRGGSTADSRMQQATLNLLADMGVQPGTLQTGLVPATQTSDTTAPATTITTPLGGANVQSGTPVTISGVATDPAGETEGGQVGGVEVSVDGGNTWHPANGRDNWSYSWMPTAIGGATIRARAVDDSGNLESPGAQVGVNVVGKTCPCSIWDSSTSGPQDADANAVEVGVKFRSDIAGFITGLRFYKTSGNTGTHIGRLWTTGGTQLAQATFAGETASGWQQVSFGTPVAINANTTYVASYHAPNGHYASISGFFALVGADSPPLHALADGTDGPNGIYKYGTSGGLFSSGGPNTFNSENYLIDVVFEGSVGPDKTPPAITSRTPASGAAGVPTTDNVTATFSEAVDPATITGSTVELRDPSNVPVSATVSYAAGQQLVTLDPTASLESSTTYTAKIKGGPGGVADLAGNPLAADSTWSFTTAAPPPPPPDVGPGGPILVISTASNSFGRYYAEVLRSEGLNEFRVTDLSNVAPATLGAYDVAILGETGLSASQVTTLSDWVQQGGNLIAMRPDPQLAALLGLGDTPNTLGNSYLKVDTATGPGAGIVGQTIQFHGTADRYTLNGAQSIATLYSNASTATSNPAVTLRSVGPSGGQAAAFAYDLAKSVVYTRQGNPAWAGDERDGTPPIRSDDLFFGAKQGDVQPDWVDLNKVAIPQADEQQRLLTNLIEEMNADRKPLPRFWFLPRDEKATVVMTGDDHGNGGTAGRFDQYLADSPPGCVLADWECVRSTSYIYPSTAGLTNSEATAYQNAGFEIGLHVLTNCVDWADQAELESFYTSQLAALAANYPGLSPPTTERTHCIAWSDWATQPKVELEHGIRLDTNYYYWPSEWVQDRPGMFTGSGMPMRFADLDGSMIDVYQAASQMTDESGQSYPFTINTLLDRALGPEGYYGVFTANMHTDSASSAGSDAIVASAQARGVPIVSARQMLTWLDGRNNSSFASITWNANELDFTIEHAAGANGLRAMLPTSSPSGPLTGVRLNGSAVATTTRTIKGREYALFDAAPGTYEATYAVDETAPVISNVAHTVSGNASATISWATNEASDSRVDYGTSPNSLAASQSNTTPVTSHSLQLTGLSPDTTYYYRVTSTDAAGNSSTDPTPPTAPRSFTTPPIDNTPPTVTLTAPLNGATVSGTTNLTATASDQSGIGGVQFLLDGNPVGAEDTSAPYNLAWNSTTVANGTHTLAARARDSAGNTAASTTVTVTVANAAAALAVDKTVTTHQTSASQSIASPAFSTAAPGEVLLAFVTSDGSSGANSQTFSSVTGGGLSWRLRGRANTQPGTSEIWQAYAPAVLTNVTVTATRSSGSYVGSITVVTFTGADGVVDGATAAASGSSGAPSVSLATTRSGSWVWGVGNDWDRATARTVGANQTKVDEFLASVGDTLWLQRQTSTTPLSGTQVTLNDTAPTNDRWNLAAIEVLPAAAGSQPPAPELTATIPPSPANQNSPKLVGSAQPGSQVLIYSTAECSGAPLATGSAAELQAGIGVSVPDNSTTALRATATASGNTSGCSAPRTYVEDSAAPDTTITSGPTGTTTDSTPTFGFSSSEPSSSFECRFDSAAFAPCSGPGATHTPATALSVGAHTFEVRAIDQAGNVDQTPASGSFTVGIAPPAPELTATIPPSPANQNSPKLVGSAQPGSQVLIYSTAECSGAPLATGSAAELQAGIGVSVPDNSTTALRATATASGNTSGCSAPRTYVEDSAAPDTTITSGPTGTTTDSTPTFGFSSSEPSSSFECRFDSAAFAPCSGPGATHTPATALSVGAHTFEVRAIDQAGNVDQTPASGSFTISTAPALALDKTVTTRQSSAAATIAAPTLSTAQPGELLLAFIGSDGPNAGGTQSIGSVTGGGLTWTLRQRTNAQAGTAEIWQAVAPTTLNNVVFTATRANGSYQGAITVAAFIGADTTVNGAVGSGAAASGAPSASLVTTRAGSWVWAAGEDWDNATARTVGPGQTLVDQFLSPSGDTFWTQRQTTTTPASGTTVVINDTAPTADRWNLSLVEVLPVLAGPYRREPFRGTSVTRRGWRLPGRHHRPAAENTVAGRGGFTSGLGRLIRTCQRTIDRCRSALSCKERPVQPAPDSCGVSWTIGIVRLALAASRRYAA